MVKKDVKPIFGHVGGKTKHKELVKKIAPEFDIIIDPFFGGGGFSLILEPKVLLANDIDPHLMNIYKQFKKSPDRFKREALQLFKRDSKNLYISLTKQYNGLRDPFRRAVNLYYIKKTSYMATYRINKQGGISFSGYNKRVIDSKRVENLLNKFSEYLKTSRTIFRSQDYKTFMRFVLKYIKDNNFKKPLFLIDPPYLPSKDNEFKDYGFTSLREHKELSDILNRMRFKVIVFNTDSNTIKRLYKKWRKKTITTRAPLINSKNHDQRPLRELIMINYRR